MRKGEVTSSMPDKRFNWREECVNAGREAGSSELRKHTEGIPGWDKDVEGDVLVS